MFPWDKGGGRISNRCVASLTLPQGSVSSLPPEMTPFLRRRAAMLERGTAHRLLHDASWRSFRVRKEACVAPRPPSVSCLATRGISGIPWPGVKCPGGNEGGKSGNEACNIAPGGLAGPRRPPRPGLRQ